MTIVARSPLCSFQRVPGPRDSDLKIASDHQPCTTLTHRFDYDRHPPDDCAGSANTVNIKVSECTIES